MKRYFLSLVTVLGLVCALYRVLPQTPGSTAILQEVMNTYWQYLLRETPELRMRFGLKIERLPEVTLKKAREFADFARSLRERLQQVKVAELDPENRLSYAILDRDLDYAIEAVRYYWLNFPVTPYTTPLVRAHRIYTSRTFSDRSDLENYLDLLKQYPELVHDIQTILIEQARRGILIPKDELEQVLAMLRSFIRSPEQSLFQVSTARLQALEEETRASFRADVARIIETRINPALQRLIQILDGDYRKHAPDRVGLWQYPDGRDYYRFLVRYHTTLDLTPEQVHALGLREVKRLEEQMATLRKELGFEGTMTEFHEFLRSDPRFHARSAEDVGDLLMKFVKAMEPKIDTFFLRKPRAPYGVRRLDPALEGAMTYGYYQPPTATQPTGTYFYNGSQLDRRSLVNAQAVIYHELIPGHHFQINLQYENEDLPNFRRYRLDTAYVEGWAEYASRLGLEMGLYTDPYQRYGRYLLDMFLTLRLVVDTGMNYYTWTRAKAMDFMRPRVLESDLQLNTETLRYAVDMPGQALGYKIGVLKILDLREQARRSLGPGFDVRTFHDWVLGHGSMPLSLLEDHIRWHIRRARPSS